MEILFTIICLFFAGVVMSDLTEGCSPGCLLYILIGVIIFIFPPFLIILILYWLNNHGDE